MKVFIASAISLVSAMWMQASLDDILAPLPEAKPVAVEESKASSTVVEEVAVAEPVNLGKAISQQALYDALQAALSEQFRPSGELVITPLRDLPDLSTYHEPFMLNIVSAPGRLSRSNALVRFEVENEKGVIGQFAIPFKPQVLTDVWYVKAHLRKGDPVVRSDFERRREDLLMEPDAVTADLDTVLRHEYGRDVSPGKALVWADLRERSLVRKGEVVDVVMHKGLLAISMRAQARQDGADGDIITLRNLDSSKDFAGRVVGVNKVNVVY